MNRVISALAQRCAQISISAPPRAGFHVFQSSMNIPPPCSTRIPLDIGLPSDSVNPNPHSNVSIELPSLENTRRVYTFPTLNRSPISAPPPFLNDILERMDPTLNKVPLEAPPLNPSVVVYAAPRLLTIRRKKMKKHKRRKRFDRDFFKYQKYHREKKIKAEREFVRRMKSHLAELEAFDPNKYVDETIAAAKKEWSDELAPTGRKLYPHWSKLMALEELYGLPASDYIDKKAGLPTEEDMETINKLKKEYNIKYKGI